VDDEQDVVDTVTEILSDCIVHQASDFDSGIQYILSYTYDVVVLDIMGVNGFELLKAAVKRGFPTVMLTAHAITPEALKKSMKLGAVTFLPKEMLPNLKEFLEDIVLGGGKQAWRKLFDKFESYLNKHFGPDWKLKDRYFSEFIESLSKNQ